MSARSTHKMITAAEHIRRRTRKEVRAKFRAQGQRRRLLRLLQNRFGALSPRLVARIRWARIETLDRWCDRVPTAKILPDIFVSD